ncbi:FtsP/CotA-like multicopper oxidase with cupredoxin domain [Stackebrandtia albiflava]|uniref:Multicopper oxidase CueO n=1 Tax=Stackebrandtia albiflava TaxID=406432 RepID=A0A562VCQ3_9ACTN|nr:multicopper oxidase domain-containing protein [Stackebrandtia albiflava]TWJ15650.1 FtsP/CotA-like multicopper oxidase with cupredoxin domain [Stackebrandtia albiflava]
MTTGHRWSRRRVLTMGALGVAAVAGGGALAGCNLITPEQAGRLLRSDLPLPERFTTPLRIPPVATPVAPGRYLMAQREAELEIVPGTRTRVWGYDGVFPGPTFDVRRGEPIAVEVRNELPAPTSTHLHGGVTPAESDGYPTDLIVATAHADAFTPGAHSHMAVAADQWRLHDGGREYEYPLDQPAAGLWYHDHRMDFTAPQVWRGLAGMFLIRDEEEDRLGLPSGERELPMMICDRAFDADGDFKYPAVDDSLLAEPGVTGDFHQGVEGDVALVNGTPWPVVSVDTGTYRLRLVNASNARRYRLERDDGGDFVQIGSDQGLLARPQRLKTLTMSPGERFDVLVDFGGHRVGDRVVLRNLLGTGEMAELLRFDVDRGGGTGYTVPDRLADPVEISAEDSVAEREFAFALTNHSHGQMWTINGRPFDPADSLASPELNTVERWTFTSDFHHPVHLHLAHFRVLTRNGKPPVPEDAGWKDTVDLRPYEFVEVAVRFTGHRGRYMMHCHNLEHEDMAMMANFDVV